MHTSIIRTVEELSSIEQQWRDFIRHTENPEIFATWEWMKTYIHHLMDPSKELFIIVVTDQDTCVAIAPLCEVSENIKWRRISTLQFIVTGLGEVNRIYIHKDYHGVKVLNQITQVLLQHQDEWDWIDLYSLQSGNPQTELVKHFFGESFDLFERKLSVAPYIDLKQYNDKKADKSRIKAIERKERKLLRNHDVTIKILEPFDLQKWSIFIELHKQRWQDSWFNQPDNQAFFKEVLLQLHNQECTYLSYLEINGHTAAAWLTMIYADKAYMYLIASPKHYAEYGIGLVLTNRVIRHLMDTSSCLREIDFLSGQQDYKFYWADRLKINYHIRFINRARRTKLLRAHSLIQFNKARLKSLLTQR
ncbi:GNAT family N-acetyltransferase [Paenibacillus aceti]|uniref:BioF2-like acetyltransferase domain-containing protein n=1 Tax=Paenibacillus aceti TaxID=1820010 RepID=A0ABQ1W996_9BACL|nr:GNAT family N-acetyltransferase [Paenibacillus aceti]GGG19948.1 hypothetical protein GCM10010913_47650 [Paenibacillus aceti]